MLTAWFSSWIALLNCHECKSVLVLIWPDMWLGHKTTNNLSSECYHCHCKSVFVMHPSKCDNFDLNPWDDNSIWPRCLPLPGWLWCMGILYWDCNWFTKVLLLAFKEIILFERKCWRLWCPPCSIGGNASLFCVLSTLLLLNMMAPRPNWKLFAHCPTWC